MSGSDIWKEFVQRFNPAIIIGLIAAHQRLRIRTAKVELNFVLVCVQGNLLNVTQVDVTFRVGEQGLIHVCVDSSSTGSSATMNQPQLQTGWLLHQLQRHAVNNFNNFLFTPITQPVSFERQRAEQSVNCPAPVFRLAWHSYEFHPTRAGLF